MLYFFIWFTLGVIFGSCISSILYNRVKAFGTFKIDHSNPDKDVYRLDFNDIEGLSKKKRVVLKVDNHADLSQK